MRIRAKYDPGTGKAEIDVQAPEDKIDEIYNWASRKFIYEWTEFLISKTDEIINKSLELGDYLQGKMSDEDKEKQADAPNITGNMFMHG